MSECKVRKPNSVRSQKFTSCSRCEGFRMMAGAIPGIYGWVIGSAVMLRG